MALFERIITRLTAGAIEADYKVAERMLRERARLAGEMDIPYNGEDPMKVIETRDQFRSAVDRGWQANGLGHLGRVTGQLADSVRCELGETVERNIFGTLTLPSGKPGVVVKIRQ